MDNTFDLLTMFLSFLIIASVMVGMVKLIMNNRQGSQEAKNTSHSGNPRVNKTRNPYTFK